MPCTHREADTVGLENLQSFNDNYSVIVLINMVLLCIFAELSCSPLEMAHISASCRLDHTQSACLEGQTQGNETESGASSFKPFTKTRVFYLI